jgi:poly [ADP-ribose] polymerase
LVELSSKFYTIIPHEFGFSKPTVINTAQLLKKKLEMLEALAEIEVATTLIKSSIEEQIKHNPLDLQYESLKCDLAPMDPKDEKWKLIETYTKNTHAQTHSSYSLNIKNIYQVQRDAEDDMKRDLGNRKLLWHGSRLTNFVGILSQGLRIAPPEAPATGYM